MLVCVCVFVPAPLAAGIDDDKSGCLQVIHAVEAYMTAVSTLPVNIK